MKNNIFLVLFIAIVAIFLANVYLLAEETEVITTRSGQLKGSVSNSRQGRRFFEFLGIPFAKPPVGELRFEPPQKAEKWEGIRYATKCGSICPQLSHILYLPVGDEDCLFLNVYTPKLPSLEKKKPLTVMVYFHGGAFVYGDAIIYRPDYFMDEDVILVTVNYRLNSLGFLNTGDGVVAGNMGLKDQNMALRWVQENIDNFGGDPNEVTIFGQSAGAASVHFHILSPMSKGLFHRAISQSGTALSPWAIRNESAYPSRRFAGKFNCNNKDTKEMIACMKKLTMKEIISAHKEIVVDFRDIDTLFFPSVESGQVGLNTFLPAHPREILKSNNFNKVPWLTGANGQDGLMLSSGLFKRESTRNNIFNNFESMVERVLYMRPNANASKIKEFYMPTLPNLEDMDSFLKLTNMFTDRYFSNGIREAAILQSAQAPVYLYDYNYKGDFRPFNILLAVKRDYPVVLEFLGYMIKKIFNEKLLGYDAPFYGVGHSDDLAMLFHMPWVTNVNENHRDFEMSKSMIKLWTSFAQNRKPLEFRGVAFKPLDPKDSSIKYLNINTTPTILDDPFVERYTFWESIDVSSNL